MSDLLLACLAITYVALNSLVPDPKNPRLHSPRQIRQIARSIQRFGFCVPILVDCHWRIVAGHGRYLAAQFLKLTNVPVIMLERLTPAQVKAFQIADNQLNDLSEWNNQTLAEALKALSDQELDFDLDDIGFSMAEIDLRIAGLSDTSTEIGADPADAVPESHTQAPISKPGDLWIFRNHRVLCGDALDAKSYSLLMPDEYATTAFTDPPYNVKISGHASGLGRIQHREFPMATGEMSQTEFTGFLTIAFKNIAQHCIDGAIVYTCMDWRHMGETRSAGDANFTELKNICVWVKPNAGMGSFYRSQHEFVLVFKSGRGSHRNNIELGQHGRHRSNVWNYPGANSFGRATDEGHLFALHPTVKPVRLIADAILDCSARGDIILDPFLGSGSTVIAAERTGRRCYGIEIDPLYIDTIIRRWQAYTGEHAKHQATGQIFNALETEVLHRD